MFIGKSNGTKSESSTARQQISVVFVRRREGEQGASSIRNELFRELILPTLPPADAGIIKS